VYGNSSAVIILYSLRHLGAATISDLYKIYEGKISNSRVRRQFSEDLLALAEEGLIDTSPEVVALIKNRVLHERALASGLIGTYGDEKVFLLDKLSRLQDILGFGLTEEYQKCTERKYSTRVSPIWEKPANLAFDVFVLMPFAEDYKPVYSDHIKPVCTKLNLNCSRADDIFSPSVIIHDVWSMIHSAKVIICDCSGRNPNVFYELGIAHTLGKKVILLAQNDKDIPFDIRHIRCIRYQYTPRGMRVFEEMLEKSLTSIDFD